MVSFTALGTPPEDDSGAGEGAPSTGTDPARSERSRSLASRIDAFMEGEDDLDNASPTILNGPRNRVQSEPGVDVNLDDRGSRPSGSIDVNVDESRQVPRPSVGSAQSIDVD